MPTVAVLLAISIPWWVYAFVVCLLMGLAAWLVFLWGVRSGQFKDPEQTAARMLELESKETAPVSGRPGRANDR